ncbi:DUF2240 family protein [Methanospirillum sp. J.3.6.1-F.2.7.3]|jgi:hypothetical protein|uniref:DUF2240 family protein n=2 Tax=Methanospirillum TaxID=2202 RepID=A0A8E7EJC2_9EURY|nr:MULTISPECIES: DUF2240 family protein [Methanospirillum]MDX8549596.1 DUF2240 family protein [Methanospirillum hungatei]QVV88979.1 DUF2240 family protein [Methanospirillum sp. J.3.6.1-F.2.7.3]QXO93688.1 DUF2240 family protein [Methanospirillum hungatei]
MTLKTALAAPFYHSRVQKLGKSELIYYYFFDRRWMTREQVDLLIHRGIEQQLLGTDGDMYFPLFDLAEVQIPIGYKPSSSIFDAHDPFEQLLDRITRYARKEPEEIIAQMNQVKSDNFDGNIRPEAALVIVAKMYDIDVKDLLPSLKQALLKKD